MARVLHVQLGTYFSMQSTYPTYPAISGPVYIVFDSLAVLCIQQNALPFGRGQLGPDPESVCGRSQLMAVPSHPWQEPPSRRHGKHSTSTACRLAGCRSVRQRLGPKCELEIAGPRPWPKRAGVGRSWIWQGDLHVQIMSRSLCGGLRCCWRDLHQSGLFRVPSAFES